MDCRHYNLLPCYPSLGVGSNYIVRDFSIVKMRNSSYSKIVGMGDVCFETNMRCKMTSKDVRHVLDFRLNLMLGFVLDKVMKTTLAKANGSLLRAHWLLQKEKHATLCIRPKGSL